MPILQFLWLAIRPGSKLESAVGWRDVLNLALWIAYPTIGNVAPLAELFKEAPLAWFAGVPILLLLIAGIKLQFKLVRFEKEKKPCLEILGITEQNVGQTGAGWSLEIWNNGIERAKGCHGNLEDIEFETPQGGLSLAREHLARDLGWSGQLENASDYTIAGGQHAMLNIVNRDSAAPDNTITLAYRGTLQFRIEHKLPQNDPILLLINIVSEGRVPLYAICLLDMKAIASNVYRGFSGRSPVTLLYHGEQRRSLSEFQGSVNPPPTPDRGGSQT